VGAYKAYIIECRDQTYYAGVTNDMEKRILTHNSGKGAKYVRGRGPVTLVYSQECKSRSEALKVEAALKKLKRTEKESLVKEYAASSK